MIKWSVKRTRSDPEKSARRLIENAREGTRDGMVLVERRGETEKKNKKKKVARTSSVPSSPSSGARGRLKFSVVLRVWEGSSIQLMRLIAPFSASEAIRKDTGIITWIRWPDSVVIGEKTVATATLAVVPTDKAAVTTTAGPSPQDLITYIILTFEIDTRGRHADRRTKDGGAGEDGTTAATSLYDALGVEVDEGLLLDKALESLAWMHLGWRRGMNEQIVRRVKTMVTTVGMRVVVLDRKGRERPGYARDIDGTGRLVVELDDEGGGSRVAVGGGGEASGYAGDDGDAPFTVRLREL
jgi:biotin-(acetyl-CoA carboxylase) ligase